MSQSDAGMTVYGVMISQGQYFRMIRQQRGRTPYEYPGLNAIELGEGNVNVRHEGGLTSTLYHMRINNGEKDEGRREGSTAVS